MKWFHHECAAKHDPKLQTLGDEFGAEGLGIYWGLLEEIGQHSDTFHLKITGVSRECENNRATSAQTSKDLSMNLISPHIEVKKIPQLSVRLLAKNLFTTTQKLTKVLEATVNIGLFDSAKWLQHSILYSPAFALRADDYTRRQQRRGEYVRSTPEQSANTVRTDAEQSANLVQARPALSPDEVGKGSDFVRLEAEQKQKRTEENRRRTEEEQNSIHACMPAENVDNSCYQTTSSDAIDFLLVPSAEQFESYRQKVLAEVTAWNVERKNKFDWHPSTDELRKLFCSGSEQHKLSLCYQAYNINNERINYPELVLRAVRLMLRSSEKKRILNPTGWLWSCLHGNGDGTTPWVQLLTADEENDVGNHLSRAISSRSSHPP
ncbi:MAG: DUF4373 domain-containing protein [Ignavibacteriae bacterium]|nr:DUF4373 domain-containing protein [Ignavibacteriota bacterium]